MQRMVIFQSTLPVRGATWVWAAVEGVNWGFQSTLPVRGATEAAWAADAQALISIHAPREGSDGGALALAL